MFFFNMFFEGSSENITKNVEIHQAAERLNLPNQVLFTTKRACYFAFSYIRTVQLGMYFHGLFAGEPLFAGWARIRANGQMYIHVPFKVSCSSECFIAFRARIFLFCFAVCYLMFNGDLPEVEKKPFRQLKAKVCAAHELIQTNLLAFKLLFAKIAIIFWLVVVQFFVSLQMRRSL